MNTIIQHLKRLLNSRLRRTSAALFAAVAVLVPVMMRFGGDTPTSLEPVFKAIEGPLMISVIENGTIQSKDKVLVRSTAEGRNTILSIVPEGRIVQTGDLLVELDSSPIVERQNEQQIKVENTAASFTSARERLEVTRNQAQADIEKAELTLKFAKLNLEKYTEGEYPNLLRQAESDIAIANEELQRAEDKLIWSRKLADSGYITRSELQGDELARTRAALTIELTQNKLNLLKKYTHVEDLEKRKSEVSQAEMALDRTRLKAASDIVQAEADLRARESEHGRQKLALEKSGLQIEACRITAPSNGMVVYATSVPGRRWNQEPLAVGQQVIERQELIHLPADSAMLVEIRIPESALAKVREGMLVRITLDALPDQVFYGMLGKIGVLPDANRSWMNPDLKVYICEVYFADNAEGLRPGMNCRAEIVINEYKNAISVPIQCVTRLNGESIVYVLDRHTPEVRRVEVGLDNNRMVLIKSGLKAGEPVLLAPPLPSQDKQQAADPDKQRPADPDKQRPAGGGQKGQGKSHA
jgi:HlyD family secretion protein